MLVIHLKASKINQLGKEVDVFVSRTNIPVSAVAAVLAYMIIRGSSSRSFSHLKEWPSTNKVKFNQDFKFQSLHEITLHFFNDSFSRHSFRIIAATTTTKAGM